MAEEAVSEDDLFSAVKFHLLGSEPEHGLQLGITYVKGSGRFALDQNRSESTHKSKCSKQDRRITCSFSSRPSEQLSGSDWTVDQLHPILDLMSFIRTDILIQSRLTE